MKILEIKDAIQAKIDHEQIAIDVFEHLSKVFEPFEGKLITKRMETALQKNMPIGFKYTNLERIAGMLYIVVVPENFSERIQFLLAYDSNPIFRQGRSQERHSGFAYYNNCYGDAAKKRNEKRRDLQSKAIKLAGFANTYAEAKKSANTARTELSELVGYAMDIEISKILGMKIL